MTNRLPLLIVVGLCILLFGCQNSTPNTADSLFSRNQFADQSPSWNQDNMVSANYPEGNGNIPSRSNNGESVDRMLQTAHEASASGRLDDAKSGYLQVLDQQPDHSVAHHRLAVIADNLQDFDTAERHYRLALAYAPTAPQVQSELYSDLGYSYLLQQRYREAETHLQKSLEFNPTYPKALNNLGLLYGKQGNYQRALAMFEQSGAPAADVQANMRELFPQGPSSQSPVAQQFPTQEIVPTSGSRPEGGFATGNQTPSVGMNAGLNANDLPAYGESRQSSMMPQMPSTGAQSQFPQANPPSSPTNSGFGVGRHDQARMDAAGFNGQTTARPSGHRSQRGMGTAPGMSELNIPQAQTNQATGQFPTGAPSAEYGRIESFGNQRALDPRSTATLDYPTSVPPTGLAPQDSYQQFPPSNRPNQPGMPSAPNSPFPPTSGTIPGPALRGPAIGSPSASHDGGFSDANSQSPSSGGIRQAGFEHTQGQLPPGTGAFGQGSLSGKSSSVGITDRSNSTGQTAAGSAAAMYAGMNAGGLFPVSGATPQSPYQSPRVQHPGTGSRLGSQYAAPPRNWGAEATPTGHVRQPSAIPSTLPPPSQSQPGTWPGAAQYQASPSAQTTGALAEFENEIRRHNQGMNSTLQEASRLRNPGDYSPQTPSANYGAPQGPIGSQPSQWPPVNP